MSFDFSHVDIAFINGQVLTVNDNDGIAEAVGIKKIRLYMQVQQES